MVGRPSPVRGGHAACPPLRRRRGERAPSRPSARAPRARVPRMPAARTAHHNGRGAPRAPPRAPAPGARFATRAALSYSSSSPTRPPISAASRTNCGSVPTAGRSPRPRAEDAVRHDVRVRVPVAQSRGPSGARTGGGGRTLISTASWWRRGPSRRGRPASPLPPGGAHRGCRRGEAAGGRGRRAMPTFVPPPPASP